MHFKRSMLCVTCLVFCSMMATVAQAQLAPRIVIGFDTSGSMGLDLDGLPTFGDGVQSGCTTTSNPGTGSDYLCGANCSAGMDTNCDGVPNDSRLYVAKEAVRNMILAYGEVDWALARFGQSQGSSVNCPNVNSLECDFFISSVGNPQCNNGTNIPTSSCNIQGWYGMMPDACEPGLNSNNPLRLFATGSPTVCLNYAGACGSGDMLVGFPDMGAFTGIDNTYGIYSWLDNQETNFVNTTTTGNYCNSSTTGDCELRATGATPLGGLLTSVQSYITPIQTADTRTCRPYSVILITDGAESCGGDPAATAATLRAAGISTYVVGLAISASSRTGLNAIATAGGTDAGSTGGDTAFFANDPATLAAGLAEIVRESLIVEECNGLDDDCDGTADEGVTNACGTCGATPTEVCNGADEDCDGITDEGVTNACGSCGPPPAETCNRLDDDCDGVIDEGACGGCIPSAEICDDLDNDCDGSIDEGLARNCGSDVGECSAGSQTCTAGVWGSCIGEVGPTVETCDGLDNDCDGAVDGMSRSCGISTGVCQPGSQVCIAGTWGSCVGAITASTEVCDGEDDDCDGPIDEGDPGGGAACGSSLGECNPGALRCTGGALVCVGATAPTAETCDGLDNDCDGSTDESVATMGACGSTTGECRPGVMTCVSGAFTCVGDRGSATEICDTLDNDCDGLTDEGNPGGGASCGTATGACVPGTTQCVAGTLTCSGAVGPMAELCDTLDNDCDGLTDEGNPEGGTTCGMTDVGECDFGAEACVAGMLVCVGESGPTTELCDGLDNDCDGSIDEGDPEGGAACGDDTGECMEGTFSCVGGMLVCMGGVGPTPEVCDGLDNDCDGVIDDGIAVGAPCGSDIGECVPGVNICRDGMLVCEGSIEPSDERCDNLDNDCDGPIDEGLALGGACGSDEGLCMPGMEQCIDGRLVCVGELAAVPEGCDCEDNDCDGAIDEMPEGLCPPGASCFECQCALPCQVTEFGDVCPTGRAARRIGDTCFCVRDACDEDACALETIERDGVVRCAPDSEDVANCVCKNNECTFACEGVVCPDGLICDPRDPLGRCVDPSCRGLGCPDGEICNAETGLCESDPCDGVSCAAGEVCRDGMCESSCADVMCPMGQRCERGACVDDLCADVSCPRGQFCDDADGMCRDDMCNGVVCPSGQVCDPLTGECGNDPCARVICPDEQSCVDGECMRASSVEMDAGTEEPDAGVEDTRTRVLASGGLCACTVGVGVAGPSQARPSNALWLLGLVLAGLMGWRRRRWGPKGWLAISALSLVFLVSGCSIDPFCLDCHARDSGVDTGEPMPIIEDSGVDSGVDAGDTGVDACVPAAEELCNGVDDDCDDIADEGIDLNTSLEHCGACDSRCAPLGAFGVCVDGVCGVDSCDVGRYDLNGDPSDGCEYRCLPDSEDDVRCDLRDNDCDGNTDEDVELDTDGTNCGSCGRVCTFPHASALCVSGACALGACDTDWYNIDGADPNGCEYSCTPADPAVELCNGRDDDCDGTVDEGDPEGGGGCGSDTGECSAGVQQCVGGTLVCVGATEPTTEVCNGRDDDCDMSTDEGNPDGGRVCGTSTGTCEAGREACMGGALVCVGDVGASSETCDGLDNDCDGMVDEGNPGGGGACGIDAGECAFGVETCSGGVISCTGAIGPVVESCNGRDDDCDSATDEGNPGGGANCGTDRGVCSPGTLTCLSGTLSCEGASGPLSAELCNSLDDDCDGSIDEGNPEAGGSCGATAGECTAGAEVCLGGTLQCMGGSGATLESCNGLDDDCDGANDEDFGLSSDVNNCGTCGTVCSFPNAVASCSGGTCTILACLAGFFDVDPSVPGCEYACSLAGSEICNGLDDDCDGATDESLVAPTTFCNPNGVCAGTTPRCDATGGWVCDYPSTYEATEVSCDSTDNDCDGAIDEAFPTVGDSCSNGTGACRRTGVIACTTDGTGTRCTAAAAGTPAANELCNNLDDDCDGSIDENIPVSAIPTVTVSRPSGGLVDVMVYEASHPDATASSSGSVDTHACAAANVMPWTNIRWAEANAACCALNASGSCSADESGWRLCDSEDWQAACQGPSSTCDWGYSSACTTSSQLTCNGEEFDSDSMATGDQDAMFPTGSTTFGMCFADWGTSGVIYDLSGNVKEWTYTETVSGVHQIRGGGYNNIEAGRACQFDFTAADNNFAFPNTGFRCCHY